MTISRSSPHQHPRLVEGLDSRRSYSNSAFRAKSRVEDPHNDQQFSVETNRIDGSDASIVSFGSFQLLSAQRLLLEDNKPLRVGSRALDILIALVERPGELVSKEELMARVWPSTFVEPANLTVHIAALRRILRDGRDGNRFLINIPGRGYRFVAPLEISEETDLSPPLPVVAEHAHNLPANITHLIIDLVAALVANSLLVADAGATESRFRMLEAAPKNGATDHCPACGKTDIANICATLTSSSAAEDGASIGKLASKKERNGASRLKRKGYRSRSGS